MGVRSGFGKGMLFLLPLLILEPAMVAFTGGTIGHHLMKIRVAKMDGSSNINFFSATIRFMMRTLLGGLSLIFVFTTAKHQALHDLMARSVVIHKDPTGLPEYDVLTERQSDHAAYVYPAIWRRVVVVAVYWLLFTIALALALALVSSAECMQGAQCTAAEKMLENLLSIVWLLCLGWVTVRGWGGQMFGCRRRLRVSA